jgi:MFS family permease
LLGGLITTGISWRAAFGFQAIVVITIAFLGRRINDPLPADPSKSFDLVGSVLSAVGLIVLVLGILAADNNLALTALLLVIGVAVLALFLGWIVRRERSGREPLVSISLFRNRASNLGMATQNLQWLILMGVSFVVSAYLQVVRGYSAIQTGVIFTAATLGILASSLVAGRLVRRFEQRLLILTGFVATIVGIAVLLAVVKHSPSPWSFAPGLLIIGLGVGVMLTPSVNVVQSAFPEEKQGEISGVSRCISNLGSSLGTAVAGTILVSGLTSPQHSYALAMIALIVFSAIGVVIALGIPKIAQPGRSKLATTP